MSPIISFVPIGYLEISAEMVWFAFGTVPAYVNVNPPVQHVLQLQYAVVLNSPRYFPLVPVTLEEVPSESLHSDAGPVTEFSALSSAVSISKRSKGNQENKH